MLKQLIVHTKDVAIIKGIGEDTARKLIRTIKDCYGKQKHQSLTIREFCEYEDLPYDEVFSMINNLSFSQKQTA
jgi:hypothetical protein